MNKTLFHVSVLPLFFMAQVLKLGEILQRDIVIALMGPTGAGKSTFIDVATRQNGTTVGHGLTSCTSSIRSVKYTSETGQTVILVDTPGFDDTTKSDTEILNLLAEWLKKTYRKHVRLTGIIYLHRITDNRMAGTSLKNLHMFGELCGCEAAHGVVLATTMWGRLKTPEVGQRRQEELMKTFWKPMIDNGSETNQFRDSYESAWDLISSVVRRGKQRAVLLQKEMVDLEKRLGETSAGVTLYDTLQKSLAEQKEILQGLRDQAAKQDNPELARHLETQYNKLQETINSTFEQMIKMKIPLTRRIILFFSFKSPRANGIPLWRR
ncbi:hypothetical protein HGRIS_011028 [Hohenbuehelia grisea]|uniref:G domain-containing protein n=1 Tax=Hohenbuehelia grisea TaxID=104357 RepID=A0ABR3IYK9_9AGAR